MFANSSINPFLFCWRLRELRGAAAKTAKKILYLSFHNLVFLYPGIFRIVRQHLSQILLYQVALQIPNTGNIGWLKKSATKSFIFYMFIFQGLLDLISLRCAGQTSGTVHFINSSVNPILYCWRLRELRTAVVQTARQVLYRIIIWVWLVADITRTLIG